MPTLVICYSDLGLCFSNTQIFGSLGSPASDKIVMSLLAASQILNKKKDLFKSLKYYLRM